MGVTGLTQYMMHSVAGGYEKIDILLEIKKFQHETGNMDPAIIIDVMGFVHGFGETKDECILGGRHNIYIELATHFFDTLTACGAKLVFMCDGQLQQNRIDVWCDRRNREYSEAMSILSEIDAGRFRCGDKYYDRGCKHFVNSLLDIAKSYGTVILATERDCDSIAAQYATVNDALSIIASDSDYLIYEGNWQHWHVSTIDMLRLTVKRFNRNALIKHFQLTREQMKVFATIAGNDYTNCLRWNNRKRENKFESIAHFCRTLPTTPNFFFYRKIAVYILDGARMRSDAIEIVKNSIESYSIDFELATDVDKLELYVRENVLMGAILKGGIFQYEVNYVDFNANNNTEVSFLERVVATFRRLSGLLLHDKREERKYFKLITKHSLETNYELTHEEPVYPELEMPTLNDLIFGNSNLTDTRWRLMLWCLNCNDQFRNDLKKIPDQFKLVVLAIVFLYDAQEISLLHADAILATEYSLSAHQIHKMEIVIPKVLRGDIVRAAQAYNRTVLLVWDCFAVCGLRRYGRRSNFDGFLFHNVCVEFQNSSAARSGKIDAIDDLRLYARPNLYHI